ncbi:MAG TPA: methionine ABC transporter permease [Lachnospiraceae bacterium]|nr:methionine ABC transporter permease [Lachnospiraceae bacterium]
MIEEFLNVSSDKLIESVMQTLYMLGWSLFFGMILGVPLGLLLVFTRKEGLLNNKVFYFLINGIVNLVRSVPFVILLVFIAPLTKAITGTRIGTKAAIVPLVFYIAPYLARLIESSFLEVKSGILEAAKAMGANTFQVIWYFLLPEAKASLVLAITTGTIGLLGATAMAGVIGGGGVGDLALTYGYQRFNNSLMVITVILLIVFVQFIQTGGNYISKRIRNHG